MAIGSSDAYEVKKNIKMNPFRSRSTIICIACLIELFALNFLAWKSGFFSSEFALVSVYIIKEILVSTATHQRSTDEMTPPIPPKTIVPTT